MGSGVSHQPSTPTDCRSILSIASSKLLSTLTRSTVHASDLPPATISWVLLGEPSSGRRTLAKHLTLLYTHQNKADLKQANKMMIPHIRSMVVQQLQILARVAEKELQYEFGDMQFGDTYDIRLDLDLLQSMKMDDPWQAEDADRITRLWATAAMQG